MYERFFGLTERPFDLTPNPRYLVLTESHREVLMNLEYGIASRKGITLLLGEAGSGKTTVIRAAIDRQPARVHAVHLHNPTLTREEFVEMLASHFRLSPRAGESKATMLIELESLLRRRRQAGETTALIVDEAQSLSLELLEEIRLLANIETDDEKLMSVIIAGQPELAARLNDEALRQFKQRVALRCELRPLERAETAAYIAGRIRAAGGVGSMVFTREAVGLIHDYSRGIPRTVSVIADNALLGGFAAGQHPVGSVIVREVCKDFDLGHVTTPGRSSLLGTPAAVPAAPVAAHAPEGRGPLVVRPAATIDRSTGPTREKVAAPERAAPVELVDPRRSRRKLFSFLRG
jgi:general secretion pathway protein A